MSGQLIRLPKPKLKLPKTATAVPPTTETPPLFETDLSETLGIRKFIEMSMADLRSQLEIAAKDGTPRKQFLEMKANAFVITAWLTSALMTVDGMLQDAATRTNKLLAEEARQ